MSRAPLHIIERGTTCVVRGNALPILRAANVRGIYTGVSRGFVFDTWRLADLCAFMDSQGIAYQLKRGDTE